ncbi:MAG: YihY/virulence factor BrkB family protein [Rhodoplanes sp.]
MDSTYMDSTNFRAQRSASLWALALSAALVAIGFRRRDEAGASPERQGRRAAKTEADAPERGWFDVLERVYERFSEDRVMSIAGGVTFFVLLAIFPAISALVSIYGLFADPASLAGQVDQLSDVLPGGAIEVVGEQMRRVTSQGGTALGITFLISLAISLWSANSGMKAMFDALNIHDEKEKRGFFRLNAVSLAFTLFGIAFILSAVAAVVVLPILIGYIGLEPPIDQALRFGRWPILLVGIAFALAAIYRFGSDRQHAKWRWITWGSAAAALLWLAASALFSWYASNFGNFDKTYGTLGAAIGFMMWMWISAMVILVGAELDAELQCQDPSMRKRPTGGLGREA